MRGYQDCAHGKDAESQLTSVSERDGEVEFERVERYLMRWTVMKIKVAMVEVQTLEDDAAGGKGTGGLWK
jgi:hypothetical protein